MNGYQRIPDNPRVPLPFVPPRPVSDVTLSQHVNDRNDPHGTLRLAKQVRIVTVVPEDLSPFNVGDFVVETKTGKTYEMVSGETGLSIREIGIGGSAVVLDPSMPEGTPVEDGHGLTKFGIWSWVKSLFPRWLTSGYAEPATVASVSAKADKTALEAHAVNESLHVSEPQKQSFADKYTKHETDELLDQKRDKTDNVCYEGSYGDWVFGGGADGMSGVSVNFLPSSEGSENGDWLISVGGNVSGSCSGKKNDIHLDFESYNPEVFNYNMPTADRKKVAEKDESFVTKSYVEGVAGELVKKPTADAFTVLLDSSNGCVLEVGTRNVDSGGVLMVGNHISGMIEVGSAEDNASRASIKKNGKEVATESQLPYSRNTTTTLKDRAFNALSFDGTEYNLSTALTAVTPTVEDAPRDLLIVATASAATTISYTAGTIKGDKPTIDGEGKWIITLTEYEPNTWYCRQIKMEDAQ